MILSFIFQFFWHFLSDYCFVSCLDIQQLVACIVWVFFLDRIFLESLEDCLAAYTSKEDFSGTASL